LVISNRKSVERFSHFRRALLSDILLFFFHLPFSAGTTDTRRIIKLWDGLPLIGKGKPLVSMITTKQPCCRDTIYTSALEPLHSKECSRGWLWRTLSLHVPLTLNCLQNCKVCCLLMCQSSFVDRAFLPGFHYFASRYQPSQHVTL